MYYIVLHPPSQANIEMMIWAATHIYFPEHFNAASAQELPKLDGTASNGADFPTGSPS